MNRKVVLALVAAASFLCLAPAQAQDADANMQAMIAQLRQTAADMRGQLPQEDIEEMLRTADELERENAAGSFAAPVATPEEPAIISHLSTEHGSVFEWLGRTTSCAGYQWENWRTWSITVGGNEAARNAGCKRAFELYEKYFYAARGGDNEAGLAFLADYDRAAHEVTDAFEPH